MDRLLRRFLPLLLVLCLGAGCDANVEGDLTGTTWVLDQVDLPPGDLTEPILTTIRFESETRVSIDSCNDCSGAFAIDGNVLDFSALVCTEIGCGDRLDLGRRLGVADRVVYSLSDDGLILIAEEESLLSTFTFVAESDGSDDG